MEKKCYVYSGKRGVSRFDLSNDSMSAMGVSDNKEDWMEFNHKDAKEVARLTDYEVVEVD